MDTEQSRQRNLRDATHRCRKIARNETFLLYSAHVRQLENRDNPLTPHYSTVRPTTPEEWEIVAESTACADDIQVRDCTGTPHIVYRNGQKILGFHKDGINQLLKDFGLPSADSQKPNRRTKWEDTDGVRPAVVVKIATQNHDPQDVWKMANQLTTGGVDVLQRTKDGEGILHRFSLVDVDVTANIAGHIRPCRSEDVPKKVAGMEWTPTPGCGNMSERWQIANSTIPDLWLNWFAALGYTLEKGTQFPYYDSEVVTAITQYSKLAEIPENIRKTPNLGEGQVRPRKNCKGQHWLHAIGHSPHNNIREALKRNYLRRLEMHTAWWVLASFRELTGRDMEFNDGLLLLRMFAEELDRQPMPTSVTETVEEFLAWYCHPKHCAHIAYIQRYSETEEGLQVVLMHVWNNTSNMSGVTYEQYQGKGAWGKCLQFIAANAWPNVDIFLMVDKSTPGNPRDYVGEWIGPRESWSSNYPEKAQAFHLCDFDYQTGKSTYAKPCTDPAMLAEYPQNSPVGPVLRPCYQNIVIESNVWNLIRGYFQKMAMVEQKELDRQRRNWFKSVIVPVQKALKALFTQKHEPNKEKQRNGKYKDVPRRHSEFPEFSFFQKLEELGASRWGQSLAVTLLVPEEKGSDKLVARRFSPGTNLLHELHRYGVIGKLEKDSNGRLIAKEIDSTQGHSKPIFVARGPQKSWVKPDGKRVDYFAPTLYQIGNAPDIHSEGYIPGSEALGCVLAPEGNPFKPFLPLYIQPEDYEQYRDIVL